MTKDKQLMDALQKNSRISIVKLARKNDLPPTTLYSILAKAEKGAIIKHSTLLDFEALGFRRYIFMIACGTNMVHVMRWLKGHPNANNIYRIDSGLLLEMIFHGDAELNAFISRLKDEASSFQYHLIEEVLKQEETEI